MKAYIARYVTDLDLEAFEEDGHKFHDIKHYCISHGLFVGRTQKKALERVMESLRSEAHQIVEDEYEAVLDVREDLLVTEFEDGVQKITFTMSCQSTTIGEERSITTFIAYVNIEEVDV